MLGHILNAIKSRSNDLGTDSALNGEAAQRAMELHAWSNVCGTRARKASISFFVPAERVQRA